MTAADLTSALLHEIAGHVLIESDSCFHFGSERLDLAAMQAAGVPTSPYPAANPLVALLRDRLYERFFTGTSGPGAAAAEAPQPDFAERLSRANRSREHWSEGWLVEQVLPGGGVRVARHGARRVAWPGEYVLRDGPAPALRPGAAVAVFQPRESRGLQPGFYFAFGEAGSDEQDEGSLLRFYWNVGADAAPALLASLTRRLNRFGLPFRFKCVDAAERCGRVDAAVLYVHRRYHRLVRLMLDEVVDDLKPALLRPATPPFTLRLAPGIALAEDPPGGESFGMHRCRLVAEGLWNAFVDREDSAAARAERVARHFRESGVSIAAPWLNPGSGFDSA